MTTDDEAVAAAIENNCMPIPECGCLVWMGTLSTGYGRLEINGRGEMVHRLMYVAAKGPIPDDLELDHLCRVRSCCNPAHLEPVTRKVNILRGESPTAKNARKTHCRRGHELSTANCIPSKLARGARACIICDREDQIHRSARRAAREIARGQRRHLATLVAKNGNMSALCFTHPVAISASRADWTLDASAVTCPRCRRIIKRRAT